jgi:SAM-dependent methyltransferase
VHEIAGADPDSDLKRSSSIERICVFEAFVDWSYDQWPGSATMTEPVDYPDFLVRFYDVIYKQIRSHVDETYFLSQIARFEGKVLEIGVGTGRLFSQALRNGADIYGLDVNSKMIEKAKEKVAPEHHRRLYVQDAVTMQLPHRFALILAPFRVFSHVIDVEDQIRCLNRIYEHLEPGGRFIFDLYVPDLSIMLHGIQDHVDFDGEYEKGKRLVRIVSSNSDIISQTSNIRMKFKWDEDGRTREAEWNFLMRFFFRYELEHLVRLSRLELETIYGDYQGNPVNRDSKDFVLICRRPS